MTLNTRLDRLAAILKAKTPSSRRYVRLIVDEEDMATLPDLQAKKLDEMVAASEISGEQRDDIDWIVRVVMPAPVHTEPPPPPYDYRPLLRSVTIADDTTAEPRKRERPEPIDYSGVGYDDTKI
ncbi:MAG: hypothetical protein WA441_05120 [Methyloceanibacter sp.]